MILLWIFPLRTPIKPNWITYLRNLSPFRLSAYPYVIITELKIKAALFCMACMSLALPLPLALALAQRPVGWEDSHNFHLTRPLGALDKQIKARYTFIACAQFMAQTHGQTPVGSYTRCQLSCCQQTAAQGERERERKVQRQFNTLAGICLSKVLHFIECSLGFVSEASEIYSMHNKIWLKLT